MRERNLDAMGRQGVIDAFQNVADDIRLLGCIGPYKQLEVDAGIVHLADHGFYALLGIHPLVMQVVDCLLDHLRYLFQIRAIGYAERYNGQHVAVVLGQVLVIPAGPPSEGDRSAASVAGLRLLR